VGGGKLPPQMGVIVAAASGKGNQIDLFDNQFAANFRLIFRFAASKFLAILSVLLRHFSLRNEKLDTKICSLLVIEQV
jgi:hypothetical protein